MEGQYGTLDVFKQRKENKQMNDTLHIGRPRVSVRLRLRGECGLKLEKAVYYLRACYACRGLVKNKTMAEQCWCNFWNLNWNNGNVNNNNVTNNNNVRAFSEFLCRAIGFAAGIILKSNISQNGRRFIHIRRASGGLL